ncbi:MAG: hypothetical protein WKG32_19280 [Gemmatimonadaceae bacterium]
MSQGPGEGSASLRQSGADGAQGNARGAKKRYIAVLDDCDPSDPAWAPSGGCSLKGGSVSNAEFTEFLFSPFSSAVVGHPAWRNEPSYIKLEVDEVARVTNEGGRTHTFTEVAAYGGGRVPPLDRGLTPAPECLLNPGAVDPTLLPPGASLSVIGLRIGTHRFECCIHPWMRAAIKVLPRGDKHRDHRT